MLVSSVHIEYNSSYFGILEAAQTKQHKKQVVRLSTLLRLCPVFEECPSVATFTEIS